MLHLKISLIVPHNFSLHFIPSGIPFALRRLSRKLKFVGQRGQPYRQYLVLSLSEKASAAKAERGWKPQGDEDARVILHLKIYPKDG